MSSVTNFQLCYNSTPIIGNYIRDLPLQVLGIDAGSVLEESVCDVPVAVESGKVESG